MKHNVFSLIIYVAYEHAKRRGIMELATACDRSDPGREYTIGQILATFTLIRTSFKKSPVPRHQKRSNSLNNRARIKVKAFLERIFHKLSRAYIKLMI